MSSRVLVLVVASFLVFLSSCVEKKYEFTIEMTPKGGALHRKISCPEDLEAAELQRIQERYPQQLSKSVFAGEFDEFIPADVGQAGSYAYVETQMGLTGIYVEHVHGNDDLAAQVASLQEHADRITDFIIGWFEAEMGSDPHFEKLRDFADKRLRQDIKNVSLYLWQGHIQGHSEQTASPETILLIGQYLVEQGYFRPKQLADIFAAMEYAQERQDYSKMMSMIRQFIAERMAVENQQESPLSLGFLSDAGQVRKSFEAYFRTTDHYAAAMKKWREEQKDESKADPPEPLDVAGELVLGPGMKNFNISIFPTYNEVQIGLALETKPYETNGNWDEKKAHVIWSLRFVKGGEFCSLPALCYAMWSKPNREFQTKHFGRILLDGDALGGYCFWRKGLDEKDANEWDEFVSSLQPADGLAKRLDSFRFSSDLHAGKDKDAHQGDLAEMPKRLIKEGLTTQPAVAPK
jgi:hypothetical protein